MYLISIYFDEKTNNTIQKLIDKVAKETGNTFMIDGKVPPHITISAFQSNKEEEVIKALDLKLKEINEGKLQMVSIGVFPQVIYLSVVLNEYLHNLSLSIYEGVKSVNDVSFSKFYMPLQWLPHITVGKKLTEEETLIAFQVMQKHFSMFNGTITKIGLSKTKPYKEIKSWEIK